MRTCPFCEFNEGWVIEQPDGKFKVICKVCGSSGPESNTREGSEEKWDGSLSNIEGSEFEQALKEDMGGASAPSANLVNTPGTGTAQPASIAATTGGQQYDSNAIGSGDKWGNEKSKKKKKKKKKITEYRIATIEEYANKLK